MIAKERFGMAARNRKEAAYWKKGKKAPRWILKLNPKGQATIPIAVRRALGGGETVRELELVQTDEGFYLRPHKPPLPVHDYVGYCADELHEVEDPIVFLRELRGRSTSEEEQ